MSAPLPLPRCLSLQEGRSQWSAIYSITTAATLPTCPVGLKLGQITRTAVSLSWSPPSQDGGSPVTDYEVGQCVQSSVGKGQHPMEWQKSQQGKNVCSNRGGCSVLLQGLRDCVMPRQHCFVALLPRPVC